MYYQGEAAINISRLEIAPIGWDGLVFLVNVSNPPSRTGLSNAPSHEWDALNPAAQLDMPVQCFQPCRGRTPGRPVRFPVHPGWGAGTGT